jgi:acyl carrier protein
MNKNLEKLSKCFASVFPDLEESEIIRLSVENCPEWDSLANIQLTSLIEEEFNIELSSEEIADLTSFELVLFLLNKKNV